MKGSGIHFVLDMLWKNGTLGTLCVIVKEKNNKGVQMSTITEGHLTADIG